MAVELQVLYILLIIIVSPSDAVELLTYQRDVITGHLSKMTKTTPVPFNLTDGDDVPSSSGHEASSSAVTAHGPAEPTEQGPAVVEAPSPSNIGQTRAAADDDNEDDIEHLRRRRIQKLSSTTTSETIS